MGCIDLHLHSSYSDDGEFSPAQLVHKCEEQGIKVMAVADHNCVRANAEGREAARKAGIAYIDALEIDCSFEGVNLHLLGYGIDSGSGDFRDIEENVVVQGRNASGLMLEATRKMGFEVTAGEMEEVAADNAFKDCWTGEMFAEVLLQKPEYQDHPLLFPYREGGARSDNPLVNFYWDYYAQGKPCYVKLEYPLLAQAVDIIHKNGGQAVLAHPGVNLKGRTELLRAVLLTGIDGVEAFSSYHSPEQARYYYQEAAAHRLFVTCGSDFHGKTKPSIQPGAAGCRIEEQEILRELKKRGLISSNE